MDIPRYPSEPLFTGACLLAAAFWIAAFLNLFKPGRRGRGKAILYAVNGLSLAAVAGLVLRPTLLVLEKQLTYLAMPLGILWIGLWIAAVVALTRAAWLTGLWAIALFALLAVAGNGYVGNWLMMQVESRYIDLDPIAELREPTRDPLDVAIILGGATNRTPAGGLQVTAAGDRVVMAARLYHAGLAQTLLCTGKGDPEVLGPDRHPAAEMTELLIELGVPAEAIDRLGGDNTREELTLLAEAARRNEWTRLGLVTSAFHMARAERLAADVGLDVVPIPVGYMSQLPDDTPFRVTPEAGVLSLTSIALKEMLAKLVGR